ncbi:hypothetical protein ACWDR1_35050 [Streptosporangium sandarakinum]|uniref:hypothetical protein n=1 Tax=Streptosporangium sandarakinum TaxID=1260955 RepID=UPI0037AF7C8D
MICPASSSHTWPVSAQATSAAAGAFSRAVSVARAGFGDVEILIGSGERGIQVSQRGLQCGDVVGLLGDRRGGAPLFGGQCGL